MVVSPASVALNAVFIGLRGRGIRIVNKCRCFAVL